MTDQLLFEARSLYHYQENQSGDQAASNRPSINQFPKSSASVLVLFQD
jgi:hypothetical protein